MDIMISKNLRDLRKARGNTQEELAEFLTVSPQAVSKWERGEGLPDISILPRIAAYYDVSLDELFGVGEIRKREKLDEYLNKSMKLNNKGLREEDLKLWREAYAEFPNEIEVLDSLMHALWYIDGNQDEIISLGERILRESTEQRFRDGALQMLCFAYKEKGNDEKAKEYAYMASSLWTSRESLLSHVLEGDDLKDHEIALLLQYLDFIGLSLISLCQNNDYARYAWLHEFYLKLMELFFDDGFCGFYACRAVQRHHWLARINVLDENKCREHLESAEKFAMQYDDLPDVYTYTSTLLNGHKGETASTSKNYTETSTELLLKNIADPHFDCQRDKDWFIALESRLREKAAKK